MNDVTSNSWSKSPDWFSTATLTFWATPLWLFVFNHFMVFTFGLHLNELTPRQFPPSHPYTHTILHFLSSLDQSLFLSSKERDVFFFFFLKREKHGKKTCNPESAGHRWIPQERNSEERYSRLEATLGFGWLPSCWMYHRDCRPEPYQSMSPLCYTLKLAVTSGALFRFCCCVQFLV